MSSLLTYKGYCAKPEYSHEDGILFGKIEGIADLVTFESESAAEIEKEFREAVDDYLETCRALGKEPEKTYKGSFNVRISPEMHKELADYAFRNDMTLNEAVGYAIEDMLHPLKSNSYIVGKQEKTLGQQVGKMWSFSTPIKNPSYLVALSEGGVL